MLCFRLYVGNMFIGLVNKGDRLLMQSLLVTYGKRIDCACGCFVNKHCFTTLWGVDMIRIVCCCLVALLLCTQDCLAVSYKELFRYADPSGAIYYIKTTDKAGVYRWYDGRDRCVAQKKGNRVLVVTCPRSPVLEAHMDEGDVLVNASNGDHFVFAQDSLFYTMFISIMGE